MLQNEALLCVALAIVELGQCDNRAISERANLSIEDVQKAVEFLKQKHFVVLCHHENSDYLENDKNSHAREQLTWAVNREFHARLSFARWIYSESVRHWNEKHPGSEYTVSSLDGEDQKSLESSLDSLSVMVQLCRVALGINNIETDQLRTVDQEIKSLNDRLTIATFRLGKPLDDLRSTTHPLAAMWNQWQICADEFSSAVDVFKDRHAKPLVPAENFFNQRNNLAIDATQILRSQSLSTLDPQQIRKVAAVVVKNWDYTSGSISIEELEKRWDEIRESAKREADATDTKHPLLFPIYLLRSFTKEVARSKWKASKETFFKNLNSASVKREAKKLAEICVSHDVQQLRPAESAFPEDRLWSMALAYAFEQNGLIAIRPQNITWGEPEDILDLQLHNELTEIPSSMNGHDILLDNRIFAHTGYYNLTRKSAVVKLLSEEDVPKEVQDEVVVKNGDVTFNHGKDDLFARCWIALALGLPRHDKSEYKVIRQALLNIVSHTGRTVPNTDSEFLVTFGAHFEDFLMENSNTFWGGSIHARLLKRWWSDEVLELLRPEDFKVALNTLSAGGHSWPLYNRLHIGENLAKKLNGQLNQFAQTATNLYREIGIYLDRSANQAKWIALRNGWASNDPKLEPMRSSMASLICVAPEEKENDEARWCFVTHEQDMVALLTKDNQCGELPALSDASNKKQKIVMMKRANQ